MKRFLSIFLAIFALSFAACTNSEEVDDNNSQGGGNEEPVRTELTISATTLLFDDKEDVQIINIYASDAWTAEFVNDRASEWCTISPKSGQSGNNSILVSVAENNSGEERSASVIIKVKSLHKVVKVTQKQNDALTVTSSKFEVSDKGGEVHIKVKANVDYDYSVEESAKSWVTYKTTRAMETSTLVFDVAENPVNKKREAQITFKSGSLKEVVTIYQEGTTYAIILTKNEYVVSDKGETIAVEVKSNVDVAVEIPSDIDWVKENTTRAMSTNTYYFEVSPNEDYDPRTTEIKFTNKANNLSETVTITQAQKDAIVLAKDSYAFIYEGNEIDIEVGHNVDFDVEISDDWITQITTRAFKAETLTFNIAANTSYDSREGTIKFISKDKAITQVVKILQEGFTEPLKNEIRYTTTDGKSIDQYRPEAFGVNIVSNIYENGKGIIKFDGDVTEIGRDAFEGCSSLTSITIPDSVTEIGYLAFYNCSNLTSVTIPDSVTKIGEWAFGHCPSLTGVTIPDSVTEIGEYAFYSCENLTTITIPDSVTEIGESAFGRCRRKAFYGKFATADNCALIVNGVLNAFATRCGATSYTIPDSVTKIGGDAFSLCYSLTSITIPDSVTEIGSFAFYRCYRLTSITIPDSVTEIGTYAFRDCSSLTSITIPDSVTEIGDKAFGGHSNLKAFYGKFASEDNRCLIIDGVLNAFAPADLTSYTIPDSVTEIGWGAFYYCENLTTITIPDSVTEIGYEAFRNCSSLTSITIPDSVTEIRRRTFSNCSSLTGVTIPDSVTEIGDHAFSECNSLTNITIPEGVTEIGDSAFYYCSSLTSVYCNPQTPPTANKNGHASWFAFDYNASGRKIYVPKNSVAAYKAAEGWRDYADAIVGYDF